MSTFRGDGTPNRGGSLVNMPPPMNPGAFGPNLNNSGRGGPGSTTASQVFGQPGGGGGMGTGMPGPQPSGAMTSMPMASTPMHGGGGPVQPGQHPALSGAPSPMHQGGGPGSTHHPASAQQQQFQQNYPGVGGGGGGQQSMYPQQQGQQQQQHNMMMMQHQQQQQPQWVQNPQTGQWMQVAPNQQWGAPQQGFCGGAPQPGPNGMMMQDSMCCPADPNQHFCETDPNKMSSCQSMWQVCDATTWLVGFFLLMTLVGFAVSVGTSTKDDLFGVYGVSDSAALDVAIFNDLEILHRAGGRGYIGIVESQKRCNQVCEYRNGTKETELYPGETKAPLPTTLATTYAGFKQPSAPAQPAGLCPMGLNSDKNTGMIGGSICDFHSLSATGMLINLSRWNNFRGTLWFIAFMGTLITLIVIIIVNKHQIAVVYGPNVGMNAPPTKFHATNLYYMFRFAWGVVSIVVFFWVCTEMYQYWWYGPIYLDATTGRLQGFWREYDKKFVGTVVTVTIYLCWPFFQLLASLGLWIGFIVPWMCVKNMGYPQLAMTPPAQVKEDEESCCISTDAFFTQFRQLSRLGFSEGMWELMTLTNVPYTNCFEGIGGLPPGMVMGPNGVPIPAAQMGPGGQMMMMHGGGVQGGGAGDGMQSAQHSPSSGGAAVAAALNRQHSLQASSLPGGMPPVNMSAEGGLPPADQQFGLNTEMSDAYPGASGGGGGEKSSKKHRSSSSHKKHKSRRDKSRDDSASAGGGAMGGQMFSQGGSSGNFQSSTGFGASGFNASSFGPT